MQKDLATQVLNHLDLVSLNLAHPFYLVSSLNLPQLSPLNGPSFMVSLVRSMKYLKYSSLKFQP